MPNFRNYLKEQKPWFLRKRAVVVILALLMVFWTIGFISSWNYYNQSPIHTDEDWAKMLKPVWQGPVLAVGAYACAAAYSFFWILRRYIYVLQHGEQKP